MRILYVGNFNEKSNGDRFYDSNRKLANGFIRNGHQVYQYSDRDIARASTWFGSRKFGIVPANSRLLEVARKYWPDFLVIGHADPIFAITLAKIRKIVPHIKIAVYNFDALWHQDNVNRIIAHADHADAIFITTAGDQLKQFVRGNNVVSFFPNPVDRSIDTVRAFQNLNPDFSLFYGMGNALPGTERHTVAGQILDRFGGSVKILGMRGNRPVGGITFQQYLGNARMGLNLSQREGDPYYSSDRMAQYTGNGLMTLIHRRTGYDQIYKEDELVFYDDFDQLLEKIAYFIDHDDEARAIAKKGWKRTHEIFNERLVTKYITEVTFRQELSEDYHWPTELHRI